MCVQVAPGRKESVPDWLTSAGGKRTLAEVRHAVPLLRTGPRMSLTLVRRLLPLLCSLVLVSPGAGLHAQSADSAISAASMETFAKAHIAVSAFRGQVQAELADPKAKKADVQATLRDKLQVGIVRILKEHGLTEPEFTRLTRRISTDTATRTCGPGS